MRITLETRMSEDPSKHIALARRHVDRVDCRIVKREDGMKRCAHCRGRFGLIRYTAYRAFGSIIQFCRKKCERAYFDELRSRASVSPAAHQRIHHAHQVTERHR